MKTVNGLLHWRERQTHISVVFNGNYGRHICIISFLVVNFAASYSAQICNCPLVNKDETTHWGGNMAFVYVESKAYRSPAGVAMLDDEPLSDVLVEIFDKPDRLLASYPQNEKLKRGQRRISACKTGADGRFCFENIPKGKYEIRASIDSGWNVTHVWILIDPQNGQAKNEDLKISMSLGTQNRAAEIAAIDILALSPRWDLWTIKAICVRCVIRVLCYYPRLYYC
jgi:hypothetical protein